MRPVPPSLLTGPFTRRTALDAEVTARVLEGSRFVRLYTGVYRHRDHVMTENDWIAAASAALPPDARTTGITRLQQLGLDFGPRRPLHFVVAGDVHFHLDQVFVHRTKALAPADDVGITPAGAFLSYCRTARVIDAIKVGDWLLHGGHTTTTEIQELALSAPWRDGAHEAIWILDHLDAASRSLKESETRAILKHAGLPEPEVNTPIPLAEDLTIIADLYFRAWRTAVEYEGRQHQDDRQQYVSDIDRYAVLRRHDVRYVQVTKEKLERSRTLVGEVYRELVAAGYDGPAPTFEEQWRMLFMRIYDVLAHDRQLARGSRAVS